MGDHRKRRVANRAGNVVLFLKFRSSVLITSIIGFLTTRILHSPFHIGVFGVEQPTRRM